MLVGAADGDDAGVVKVRDDLALVQTVDIFPPIVDDPRAYGAIAAANALSDVYAMGGTPLSALNLVAFPEGDLDLERLHEILEAAHAKVHEAGAVVLGGHSIRDAEVKFGLAVTGTVHPGRIVRKNGARAGDVLFLTKPLGMGAIATAGKMRRIADADLRAACDVMAMLNRGACEAMLAAGANACTDITGFGFLGHAADMARRSGATFRVRVRDIPFQGPAEALAALGILSGGAARSRAHLGSRIEIARGVPAARSDLLYDAETSGGLLVSLPEDRAGAFLRAAEGRVACAALVGEVLPRRGDVDITLDA